MGQKLNRFEFYRFIHQFATQHKHCLLVFVRESDVNTNSRQYLDIHGNLGSRIKHFR
jgi:hypothetical protein